MESVQHVVIIGAGPAGTSALDYIRSRDGRCRITVISDEKVPYYVREHLHRAIDMESGEIELFEKGLDMYEKLDANFVGGRVERVDSGNSTVFLESGESISYDLLLIASGGKPRVLDVPGMDRKAVSTFYTLEDLRKVKARLDDARTVAIVGAGTIAIKLLPVLSAASKKIIIEKNPEILGNLLDQEGARIFREEILERGVEIYEGKEIMEFEAPRGERGRINFFDGTVVNCDLALVTIGIQPSIGFLENSGIVIDRGVVVDSFFRTNVGNVFAAGDVAQVPDFIQEGKPMLHPSWSIAKEQGMMAAKSMLQEDFVPLPPIRVTKLRIGELGCIAADYRVEGEKVENVVQKVNNDYIYVKYQFKNEELVGGIMIGRNIDLKQLKQWFLDAIRKKEKKNRVLQI